MFKSKKSKFSKKTKREFELRALHVALAVLVGLVLAGWLVYFQMGKDQVRVTEMRQTAQSVAQDATPGQPTNAAVPPNTPAIGDPFKDH